jgi:Zn-dependent peptidase ImmA (M78 family)/transcriptional regulator with XRE-family HTH domain
MIVGERVRQARELHCMTQGRLIEEIPELTQSRLSRIEKAKAQLPVGDMAAAMIAATTGVTVDWLSRPPSVSLSGLSPHFRARSRTTETTKASGLAWAALVNEAHVVLADRVRGIPVQVEPAAAVDPRQAARELRRLAGFSSLEPLPYLVLALERLGVRVLGLPWAAPTVDAFCAWCDDVPTIALSADVPGDRRRWTVAHELGHLLLHDRTQQGRDVEAEADAFAAELLTPLDALRLQMPAQLTLRSLTMLKSQWGVSVKSLVRRARELGVIDDDRATSLYRQISARGWNRAEPGYVAVEKPRALRKMVEIALGSSDAEALAQEMGWSTELAQVVLDQHARADELPMSTDLAAPAQGNVLPLRPRQR